MSNTNQGERAAEEVKGGIKGIHNIGEDLRHNINAFADKLIGGNKTRESTGIHPNAKGETEAEARASGTTHPEAKQAGADVQAATERIGDKLVGSHPDTAATGHSHATGAPVVDSDIHSNTVTGHSAKPL